MLLHQPSSDAYGAYRALEELYNEGKLRAIGISNFYADRMVNFASFYRAKPMVNQAEVYIFNQQKTSKEWAEKYGIQLEAWVPLGEGRGGTFGNPVVAGIAEEYGKIPAQVMLRWHIQRGVVVIPKSAYKERMAENRNVFDFALTAEDIAAIVAIEPGGMPGPGSKQYQRFLNANIPAAACFGDDIGKDPEEPVHRVLEKCSGRRGDPHGAVQRRRRKCRGIRPAQRGHHRKQPFPVPGAEQRRDCGSYGALNAGQCAVRRNDTEIRVLG